MVSTPIILCAHEPKIKTTTATIDIIFTYSAKKSYSGNLVKITIGKFMD